MGARKIVACCWDVKQPTNKQTNRVVYKAKSVVAVARHPSRTQARMHHSPVSPEQRPPMVMIMAVVDLEVVTVVEVVVVGLVLVDVGWCDSCSSKTNRLCRAVTDTINPFLL